MRSQQKKCLIDGCDNAINAHGLCGSCYRAAKRLVDSGEETWETLAKLGLAASKKVSGKWGLFSKAHQAAKSAQLESK